MDFKRFLQECDQEIRAGQAAKVVHRLNQIKTAEIPRSDLLAFANLCRRTGLTSLGLRLLAPYVRLENSLESATPAECAEYATLLTKNGSATEPLQLLKQVPAKAVPEVTMYRGFCHLVRWDYTAGIQELTAYLAAPANDYSAFVAKVNLASALISSGRMEEAQDLLDHGIEQASRQGWTRLLGNCHELRSQVHLLAGNLRKAHQDLDRASTILGAESSSDQLFVLKWRAILSGIETSSTEPIERFRVEALARRHWESVRECDFFALKIDYQQDRFEYLFFGTPYSSYRERVRRLLAREPAHEEYVLGGGNRILDLATGLVDGESLLNPGKETQLLLSILLRDFYKPVSLGALFAELFPNEYFDPYSSQNRVHQIIWRARSWIKQCQLDLQIDEVANAYRIVIGPALAVRVPLALGEVDTHSVQWRRLAREFSSCHGFKSDEVIRKLGLSESSFRRLAKWGLERGLLQRQGQGPSTFYTLVA